jgi:hypothetical protein
MKLNTETLILSLFKEYLHGEINRDSLHSVLKSIEEQTGKFDIKFYNSNLVYSSHELYKDLYGPKNNRDFLENQMFHSVYNTQIEIFYNQNQ